MGEKQLACNSSAMMNAHVSTSSTGPSSRLHVAASCPGGRTSNGRSSNESGDLKPARALSWSPDVPTARALKGTGDPGGEKVLGARIDWVKVGKLQSGLKK